MSKGVRVHNSKVSRPNPRSFGGRYKGRYSTRSAKSSGIPAFARISRSLIALPISNAELMRVNDAREGTAGSLPTCRLGEQIIVLVEKHTSKIRARSRSSGSPSRVVPSI